jgi:DNA helicase-4
MSAPPFKELFKEFRDLEYRLRRLRRIQTLRNILKILGIGFIIYRNVQKEIEESLSRRKLLLGNLVASTSAYLDSFRNGMESIRTSSIYLTEDDETHWLSLLSEFSKDVDFLRSASVLDNSQAVSLLSEIGGFKNSVEKYNAELEKTKLKQQLLKLKTQILQSEKEFNSLYYGQFYFSKRDLHNWKMKWAELVNQIEKTRKKAGADVDFRDSIERVIGAYNEGGDWLKVRNTEFAIKEIKQFRDYFENVESKPLTEEQMKAIVTDEVNNLIVAGAGTGKTSTIIGKAGYLVKKGLAKPEDILLLSFNKDVSLELKKRVESRLGTGFQVKTYHSFGLQVIAEATKTKPSVSELAVDKMKFPEKIYEFLRNRMKNPIFAELVNEYFLYYSIPYKSILDFDSFREYVEYIKQFELRSLKGDRVKSFEECFIANFLYINGVDYVYEKPYEIKTADMNHRQYRPDFYLPQYRLYIEHFGIDRDGKPARHISESDYKRQMQWKRALHASNKTTLIQTYSYEQKEGTLLKNLERNLREKGVVLNTISKEQIFAKLEEFGRVDQFSTLLCNFINLYKSCGKSVSEIANEVDGRDKRTNTFLEIFSAVYDDYMAYLKEVGEIDFNDMLNDATKFILSGEYLSDFKYVLVDEFQDVSYSRYQFLKALLDQNKSKLFAVGDDWQSIYRFTGSDISLMVDFEKNFDFGERCLLQESFRLNDKLCDFSTKFILQNPIQIRKNIRSAIQKGTPSVTIVRARTEIAVKEILEDITRRSTKKESVFIVGRYNRLEQEYLKDLPQETAYLSVEYTTAHSSKGLEADYVILIGITGGRMGFPCQIVDDPILNIVLAKGDSFPNAEERRLFYVAVTRAKKHVFIIDDPALVNSSFISEILRGGYEFNSLGQPPKTISCTVCETGEIVSKEGKYGRFFQCSNFPYCDYTPEECPDCRKGFLRKGKMTYQCSNNNCSFSASVCPLCDDGYLVRRKGRNGGYFFGCVNYPQCKYIQRNDSSRQYIR